VARVTSGSQTTNLEVFPSGSGLEFLDLPETDTNVLNEYMEHEELRIFGPEEGPKLPSSNAIQKVGIGPVCLSKEERQQSDSSKFDGYEIPQ
jgi:hypothetical protein